jgi:hypothetical protein
LSALRIPVVMDTQFSVTVTAVLLSVRNS